MNRILAYRASYLFGIVSIFLLLSPVHGASLADSKHFKYEVLFTNPQCGPYPYASEVYSNSNHPLEARVPNVYCTFKDARASGARDNSPQNRLRQWIQEPSTKEIFMTYLSFSSSSIRDALCKEIKERNLKLTFILDHPVPRIKKSILDKSRKALRNPVDREVYEEVLGHDKMKAARYIIKNCQAKEKENNPTLYLRGHVSGIAWSHNKLTIINPNSKDKIKIIFSSGNMSSGVVLHHENWHFITSSVDTYFSQVHLCLKNAMIDHTGSREDFNNYIHKCRNEIADKYEEEYDIKVFLVPAAGDGQNALSSIRRNLEESTSIGVAAHRFSYASLMNIFSDYLNDNSKKLSLIVDDDIYWASDPAYKELGRSNNEFERSKVNSLIRRGASVRYMETNHWNNLLHHNKFIVFYNRSEPFAAFAGAGNFTGTAFGVGGYPNLENFYLIRIPSVVQGMANQYDYMWSKLATDPRDMPKTNVPE